MHASFERAQDREARRAHRFEGRRDPHQCGLPSQVPEGQEGGRCSRTSAITSKGRLMDVKVVSLSQEVSFEDGSITNILLMRLPSGRSVRAVITDASVRMLHEDLA